MPSKEEAKKYYIDFIESQRSGYEVTAEIIGFIVEKMKEKNMISDNVKITGRIKNFESAYENVGKKNVDDYFGLRIIAEKEELKLIELQIKKIFTIDQVKDHSKRKNTIYNAIHEMVHLQPTYADKVSPTIVSAFPIVEIQYWDEETKQQHNRGELSYIKYKNKNYKDTINEYKRNPDALYEKLPEYYAIKSNSIVRLTKEESLNKTYPEIGSISVGGFEA